MELQAGVQVIVIKISSQTALTNEANGDTDVCGSPSLVLL